MLRVVGIDSGEKRSRWKAMNFDMGKKENEAFKYRIESESVERMIFESSL